MKILTSALFLLCGACLVLAGHADFEDMDYFEDSKHEYEGQSNVVFPKIRQINIHTEIKDHYKRSDIKIELKNPVTIAHEANFSIYIPHNDAFIEDLELKVGGRDIDAIIDERHTAKSQYKELASHGRTVAYIEKDLHDHTKYNLHVNMEPNSECKVKVTTGEIIPRLDKKYNVVSRIYTTLPVKKIEYHININDRRPLTFVKTFGPSSAKEGSKNDDTLPNSKIMRFGTNRAAVIFTPDKYQISRILGGQSQKEGQTRMDFVVEYDVDETVTYGSEVEYMPSRLSQYYQMRDIRPFAPDIDGYHLRKVPLPSLSVSGISVDEYQRLQDYKRLEGSSLLNQNRVAQQNMLDTARHNRLVTRISSMLVSPDEDELPIEDHFHNTEEPFQPTEFYQPTEAVTNYRTTPRNHPLTNRQPDSIRFLRYG